MSSKTNSNSQLPETKKTILDFIKELKKYNTVEDVIDNIFNTDNGEEIAKEIENSKSKKGFIYELLWDICIKFNITNFTKETTKHGIGNINIKNASEFKEIEKYIDKYLSQGYISGNSGGYSDITFTTNDNLNLVSVKYIDSKNIADFDIQKLCTLVEDRKSDSYNQINILLFVKDKEKFKKIYITL
tara:strand:+ start:351 stop:911 length:561 start_codon:yes stop_codon:yes gene_type:complete